MRYEKQYLSRRNPNSSAMPPADYHLPQPRTLPAAAAAAVELKPPLPMFLPLFFVLALVVFFSGVYLLHAFLLYCLRWVEGEEREEDGGKRSDDAADCAVCLSEIGDGDAVRVLTVCCHAFHQSCIDPWLAARPTCPLCRSRLDGGDDGGGGVGLAIHVD